MHRFTTGRGRSLGVKIAITATGTIPGTAGFSATYSYTVVANGAPMPTTLQWYLPSGVTYGGTVSVTSLPYSQYFYTPALGTSNVGTYTLKALDSPSGAYTVATALAYISPSAPSSVTLTPLYDTNKTLKLSFTPGSTNYSTLPATGQYEYKITTSSDANNAVTPFFTEIRADNATSNIVISNCTIGTSYYAHVRTKVATGYSVSDGAWATSAAAIPYLVVQVINSNVTAFSSTSISWSWNTTNNGGQGPNGWEYALYASNGTAPTGGVLQSGGSPISSSTSATFNSLTPGSVYQLKITAYNAAGSSYIYTPAVTCVEAPLMLTVTGNNTVTGQLTFNWTADARGGTGLQFQTQLWNVNSASWIDVSPTAWSSSTSRTITGLTVGVLYFLRVTPKTSFSTGNSKDSANTYCAGAPDKMSTPTWSDQSSSSTAPKIRLSWGIPPNNGSTITGYTIHVYNYTSLPIGSALGAFTGQVDVAGSTTLSADFTTSPSPLALTAGNAYVAYIRAVTFQGFVPLWSNQSAVKIFGAPEAPSTPYWSTVSANTMRINWSAPTANLKTIQKYNIRVYDSSDAIVATYTTPNNSTTSDLIITSANGGKTCRAFVQAVTSDSLLGLWSAASGTTTFNNVPQAITVTATLDADTTINSIYWGFTTNNSGGTPTTVYNYIVDSSADNVTWTLNVSSGSTNGTSATTTGLANQTYYRLRVTGTNLVGTSTTFYSPVRFYTVLPAPSITANYGATSFYFAITGNSYTAGPFAPATPNYRVYFEKDVTSISGVTKYVPLSSTLPTDPAVITITYTSGDGVYNVQPNTTYNFKFWFKRQADGFYSAPTSLSFTTKGPPRASTTTTIINPSGTTERTIRWHFSGTDDGGSAVTNVKYKRKYSTNNSTWLYLDTSWQSAGGFFDVDWSNLYYGDSNGYYQIDYILTNAYGDSSVFTSISAYYTVYSAPSVIAMQYNIGGNSKGTRLYLNSADALISGRYQTAYCKVCQGTFASRLDYIANSTVGSGTKQWGNSQDIFKTYFSYTGYLDIYTTMQTALNPAVSLILKIRYKSDTGYFTGWVSYDVRWVIDGFQTTVASIPYTLADCDALAPY